MFKIFENQSSLNRRELLQVGGIGAMGLTLPMLLEAQLRGTLLVKRRM